MPSYSLVGGSDGRLLVCAFPTLTVTVNLTNSINQSCFNRIIKAGNSHSACVHREEEEEEEEEGRRTKENAIQDCENEA